jgi:glycerol-3-phosphate cytidylyltransferase
MFELFETIKQTKKIGFTCGTFDLLHAGHIMMLEESKSYCDYLIVGLLSDPTISRPTTKNKPVESMWERFIRLQTIKVVDYIVPWDTEEDLENMLQMIRPHIRFVGEEYKNKGFTGDTLCTCELGIEIVYNTRTHKYSSTATRTKVEDNPIKKQPEPPELKSQCYCSINNPQDCHHCVEAKKQQESLKEYYMDVQYRVPESLKYPAFQPCAGCAGQCISRSECFLNNSIED